MQQVIEIHTDGGSRGNPGPGACAFVAESNGKKVASGSLFLGNATNNVAEYNAVLLALKWLAENANSSSVVFYLDSELVARQLNGIYKIKNKDLLELSIKIKGLINKYQGEIVFKNVPREQNKLADLLVNKELDLH